MGTLRLIVAVLCAALLSQFPAFSDQYVQRLGGQVDALSLVAQEFDDSAHRAGLDRAAALADLSRGGSFGDAHSGDMAAAFARLDRARADLVLLRAAGPLERMALVQRLRDAPTLRATWQDFAPAVPVTRSGVIAAAIGLILGWLVSGLLLSLVPRRRDRLGWR